MATNFTFPLFLRVFTCLFLFFGYWSASGQVKFEKEERIQFSELPSWLQTLFNDLPAGKKGKWYRETGLETETYEYKAVYYKRKYSIEFSKKGKLQDVEILLKKKDISDALKNKVCEGLRPTYKNFRVLKTQIQIIPSIEKLPMLLSKPPPLTETQNTYELVVEVPAEKGKELREILLSEGGEILSSKKIISGNQDNLEF